MVRFTILASGSKGNSSVITAGHTRILVDAGLSCRELFRRMQLADEDPLTLDAILITHEHADHVNGLVGTARKLGIPVYFTESTHRAWMRQLSPRRQMTYAQWLEQRRQQQADKEVAETGTDSGAAAELSFAAESGFAAEPGLIDPDTALDNPALESDGESISACDSAGEPISGEAEIASSQVPAGLEAAVRPRSWLPAVEYFEAGVSFSIGEIAVSPFTISHDAADPVGFVFAAEGVRLALATDLGYLSPNVKAQLAQVDLLQIESNHDLEMLRDGPYPWSVKQRVLSRVGHLSNDATGEFLEQEYDGQASYVILAHLSEKNNLPDLARICAEQALTSHASLLANRLLLARQHEPLRSIYF